MGSIWQVVAVLCLLVQVVYNIFLKKRKKLPPGPKGFPIIGNLHMLGKNVHQDLHQLAKKHGPIMSMRFGCVPVIVASTPHAAEQFLKTHDLVFASRPNSEPGQYLLYESRDLLFGKYGPCWRNMRKLCTLQLLTNMKINSFQTMRKQELGNFVNFLKEEASNGAEVDVTSKLASLTANMSCLMIFGKKYMDEEFDERGFNDVFQESLVLMAMPNIRHEFLPFLSPFDLQGLIPRLQKLAKIYDEFLEKVIAERLPESKEQNQANNFVDNMMTIMQSREAGLEHRHVKAILMATKDNIMLGCLCSFGLTL